MYTFLQKSDLTMTVESLYLKTKWIELLMSEIFFYNLQKNKPQNKFKYFIVNDKEVLCATNMSSSSAKMTNVHKILLKEP